jgi:hypothetical protein
MKSGLRNALLGALACFATSSGAVTLNFDSLTVGNSVDNAYQASGAIFSGPIVVTNNVFTGVLTVPSPPNYVAVSPNGTLTFVDPLNPARAATTNLVSIDNPSLTPNGGCYNAIRLDAFGLQGNLLGSVTVPAVGAAGSVQTTTSLTFAGIHSVVFTNLGGPCIAPLDNVTFNAVTPVAVADVAVPGLGPAGLALTALLLAALGTLAMRRRQD